MKKFLKRLVVFILSCILMSLNCLTSMAFYDLPYVSKKIGSITTHYNVKIDGIYYNITIYGKEKSKNNYSVTATYAYKSGNALKIPNKIKFKGKQYKVENIEFYQPAILNEFGSKLYDKLSIKWEKGKFSLPYETIYLPNNATNFILDSYYMKVPKLRKIYIGRKLKYYDLESLSCMPKLKVIIDKKNPYIRMKNGAVYSKNGKRMYFLVNSKKTYKIAKGTKYVHVGQDLILQNVTLPSSTSELTDEAFSGCTKLKSVKLNKNLKVINIHAFNGCESLKKITIPKNVHQIGFGAFENCKKLSKVIIENKEKAPVMEDEFYKLFKSRAVFANTRDGIEFIVKNQTVADQLKEQLTGTGVKNAKILIGEKVVYQNING